MTDLLFQPLEGQRVSLEVDFHTFHHALLVNVAFVAQKMVSTHFPTHGSFLNFFLWQKWGVITFKRLAFYFQVHPMALMCDNAIQKIITVALLLTE